jgi:hypothetical protein
LTRMPLLLNGLFLTEDDCELVLKGMNINW